MSQSTILAALLAVMRRRGSAGWLVGGSVRDRELGRFSPDVDVVVADDPAQVTREVATGAGRPWFALSAEWGAYRVVGDEGHIDVAGLRGGSLEADLALRDFTLNAMALPLAGGPLVDPFDGRQHLREGRLVAVDRRIFADDPLRLLRAVRLAHTLGLTVEDQTSELARAEAWRLPQAAAERILAEVVLTLEAGRSATAVCQWAHLGLLEPLFPEVVALHGVTQSPFHHLDVYGHTLGAMERLDEILAEPGRFFGLSWEQLETRLAEPVDGLMSRPVALRLGALLHDVAKPQTRAVDESGRVTFWGHTEVGAGMAGAVCTRLRCSAAATSLIRKVVEEHLRVGFVQHEEPLSSRILVSTLWALAPWEPEVLMVSVADRLATRGPRTPEESVDRHLATARTLMDAWCRRAVDGVPRPPLGGHELMAGLDLKPGPLLGEVLREVTLAWEAGEVAGADEALALAAGYLQQRRGQGLPPGP